MKSPINCNEPQSLTSQQLRRSEVIVGDEGYTVLSEKVDELEQHMPSKSIERRSVTSQPIKSVKLLEDERNTVRRELQGRDGAMKTHHSALGGTPEEIVKEHAVAVERDEPIEESAADDFEYAARYEDVGHAMITASQPSSLQTMKSLPQQVNMKKMVLENERDISSQLPSNLQRCEDGTEQEEQVLEMQKSTPIINSHKGIAKGETSSYTPDNILRTFIWINCKKRHLPLVSQYLGKKSLDEAKEIFGVSQTESKKRCRDVGIMRWQNGKRKMGSNSSSKHKQRLNNGYSTDNPRVQDQPVISYTTRVLNTMDVKIPDGVNKDILDWSDFNNLRIREDLDSIASSARTDGDCSGSDNNMQRQPIFSCSDVESNDRVVEAPPCRPQISLNSQVRGVVEQAASWKEDWESASEKGNGEWNVEGIRADKSENQVLDWYHDDWNWETVIAYNSCGTDEMQGTRYSEDIDSISSGANAYGCSENEAISSTSVYGSNNTAQRPGILSLHKRDSWGDIGSAKRHYRSISNQHMSSNASTSEANNVEIVHPAPEMVFTDQMVHTERKAAYRSKREKAFKNVVTHESLSKHFGRPLDDARKSFGVSRTAFKNMCRDVGILRWKYGKRNMDRSSSKTRISENEKVPSRNFSAGMPPVQFTTIAAHASQDLNMMRVKATYNGLHIRFKLSNSAGKSELEDNVIKRLHLKRNTFTINYQDDDCDWILITCDEDLQECRDILRSSNKTTINLLILHQPGDHNAQ